MAVEINSYPKGSRVRVKAEFKNEAGVLTNATVTLTVKDPSGDVSTPSVTNDGTGLYSAAITCNEVGKWYYRFVATGAIDAANENHFVISRSVVSP